MVFNSLGVQLDPELDPAIGAGDPRMRGPFSYLEICAIVGAMPFFPKPAEGSWTEHFGLDTTPVSYEDSISPGALRARA